ncbi:TetR/AcrR family transcriptional regulator [Actinomadura syzygii]|uniref:TetR/AcrR family transcriptional regulator n=1 Tax=Actinomadura syzygii TaxID=1427538 RepID=A0A5D0UDP0_9ACTN|nr:TetR/AcrR family transcriptional regulator [Actinomadura syzygii]TYC15896.1 TetR/AcrR family transcriptional regulator [Actinomadura syzygii]
MSAEPRADARRNRETLLAVAREVFDEQGTDASLRDVARRAGVGIGTLYRHFPTRDALLEAVLRTGLENMRAAAEKAIESDSPRDALIGWLRLFSERSGACRGLPASVLGALGDDESELHASSSAMMHAAERLLTRAQEAGEVRPDVTAEELFAASAALGWVAEYSGRKRAERILALLGDGLAKQDCLPTGSDRAAGPVS